MEEQKFSGSFVLKTALLVMCVSVILSIALSLLFFRSYFSDIMGRFSELTMVDALVETQYYNDYDRDEVLDSACRGYVSALGDVYSYYYDEDEYQDLVGMINSGYVGIGVYVGVNADGNIEVTEVVKDGPAEIAGILPGDIITHIDDASVIGESTDTAVSMIKSDVAGTEVLITVLRNGAEHKFTVVRQELHEETVFYNMLQSEIGYIRISKFLTDTGESFEEKLKTAVDEGAKGIIIDLRYNPGGESHAAEAVMDALLDKCVMYYSVNKNGEKEIVYAKDGSVSLPVAVLVNGSSASASELVVGALKDNERAYIVGEKTFGKGIIQGVFNVTENSALKITVAEYFTPDGFKVQGNGIMPDNEVTVTNEYVSGDLASDNQLWCAYAYLTGELIE